MIAKNIIPVILIRSYLIINKNCNLISERNTIMDWEIELKSLQSDLAFIDLLNVKNSGYQKFLVLKLQDIKVKMYQEKGHSKPHLHIDYGKNPHIASYSIPDGKRLSGSLDRKYDLKVQQWIDKNSKVLLELWNTVQMGDKAEHLLAQICSNSN